MKSHTVSRLLLALTATFSLAAPIAATASDIVGGWYGLGSHVFTFLSDGEYYLAASDAPTDMEHGTYTWDSATGIFTHSIISDTNTDGGLSGAGNLNTQVNGNTWTVSGGDGTYTFARVTDPSNPIVGSWHFSGSGEDGVFTFLSDGTYFMADNGNPALDPSGQKGIERGTFTWNSTTGAFTHSTQIDTNGQWGLSSAICNSAYVSGSTLTMSCADTWAPTVFSNFTATNAAAVPEPGVYAMMLAGLGMVGFAARRRKAS
jgi:hypothetical protein